MQEVKEKRVELIELFYDLIYVYAISRLTALIELPGNGFLPLTDFLRYMVLFFVILQSWLYLTNYVNRYGTWKWYEYAITIINMIAAIYLSNTISIAWENNYIPFNAAMLVMLLSVVLLYLIKTGDKSTDPTAAWNSIKILIIVCCIYVFSFLLILAGFSNIVIWTDVAAVLTGAFLPFFIRGSFDPSIISFPHLVERFELLTIITFGESIVGMTDYFDIENFTLLPILIFAVIIILFGSYVIQIHELMDHHQVQRALPLMFSHYFIVIAINLITVGIHMLHSARSALFGPAGLLVVGEMLFYYALMSNRIYYSKSVTISKKELLRLFAVQMIGVLTALLGHESTYAVLMGMLWTAAAGFVFLHRKLREKGYEV